MFHHHIELDNDNVGRYPKSVHFTESGEQYIRFAAYDANALYAFTIKGPQPTGAGFFYEKNDDGLFSMSPMMKHQTRYSLESIEWLENISTDGLSTGICHALNTGEKRIGSYFVDGYAKDLDGRDVYFEYGTLHSLSQPKKS